jgi:hypothetical protein
VLKDSDKAEKLKQSLPPSTPPPRALPALLSNSRIRKTDNKWTDLTITDVSKKN